MGLAHEKRKSLRQTNTQSVIITKEKTSVLKRIPKSKKVLKPSKTAPNANESLRKSSTQSATIVRDKPSVLERTPRSKEVLKLSKFAPNVNLKSKVVKRQLREQRNSTKNNNADNTEPKTLERTKTDKNEDTILKNAKSAQKNIVSNASVNHAPTENGANSECSRLRSGKKRKLTKSDSREEFSEAGIVSKNVAIGKKQKLLKKRKQIKESEQEPKDSDEKGLSKNHILQCVNAIFHLTQENLENQQDVQQLFSGERQPIFMQVTCVRIPKVPRRNMRMILPHSIITPDDDIALFVCDLEKGRRKDYEPTKDHYQDLLKAQGFKRRITVIPMNQVKTEYDQFELKRKLAASYDHFFVDGRISGHITHLLGNEFSKRRKIPVSVRIRSKSLKQEIECAMRKTTMRLHSFGDTHLLQVANTFMEKEDILENILAACEGIAKMYPGGWANVRSLRIKTPLSLGIPIFITLKNKNSVPVPVVEPKRPKAYRTVEDELSTIPGRIVTVTPEGTVSVTRQSSKKRANRVMLNKNADQLKS